MNRKGEGREGRRERNLFWVGREERASSSLGEFDCIYEKCIDDLDFGKPLCPARARARARSRRRFALAPRSADSDADFRTRSRGPVDFSTRAED